MDILLSKNTFCRQTVSDKVVSEIHIPAYTGNGTGLLVSLDLEARSTDALQLYADGQVATSLQKIFKRAISILSRLHQDWKILTQFEYRLISRNTNFRVMDARSASLSLCISLINILRHISGLSQVNNLIGTGILRFDGSFDESSLEDKKQSAALHTNKRFLNSASCPHVFNLVTFMNQYQNYSPSCVILSVSEGSASLNTIQGSGDPSLRSG